MKKYTKPELMELELVDVLATSGEIIEPKTAVEFEGETFEGENLGEVTL